MNKIEEWVHQSQQHTINIQLKASFFFSPEEKKYFAQSSNCGGNVKQKFLHNTPQTNNNML